MKKIFFALLIFCFYLAGVGLEQFGSASGKSRVSPTILDSSSQVVGEWVYTLHKNELSRQQKNGSKKQRLSFYVTTFVVKENTIYFSVLKRPGALFVMKSDGMGKELLLNALTPNRAITSLAVTDSDKLIFSTSDGIFSVELSSRFVGTPQAKILSTDITNNLLFVNHHLYYVNESDHGGLYRAKSDGSDRIRLTTFPFSDLFQDDDSLYFMNEKQLYELFNENDEIDFKKVQSL